jgi:dolichyl-phosphate beta-glucosyltransferase
MLSHPIARSATKPAPPSLQCLTPIVVILPIHNAQATLPTTLRQVQQYLYRHPHVTCLFIDDGSTDRSRDILAASIHQAKTPQMQLLSYQPTAGTGYAVRLGMRAALPDCEYLCLLDGDFAAALDHLDDLMIALQRSDIVIGDRTRALAHSPHSIRRRIQQTCTHLAQRLLGLHHADPQAGLKGFRASAAQTLFHRQSIAGTGFDLELLYIAAKHHLTIAQIPVQPSAQPKPAKLIRDSLALIAAALRIRRHDLLGRYR